MSLSGVRVAVYSYLPDVLGRLVDLVQALGCVVVAQGVGGREAIEQARSLLPAVVVLDDYTVGMPGADVCRAIRSELGDVRVIFVGIQGDWYLRAAMYAGASDYLLRPIKPDELEDALGSALARPGPEVRPEPPRQEAAYRSGFWSGYARASGARSDTDVTPAAELEDEENEEEASLEAAERAAIEMGPPNRHKRIRRQWVAAMEVEYMPGQWSQTYSVDYAPRTGRWTVWDIRASSDGGGSMDTPFDSLADAVSFVAGQIGEHEGHTWGQAFRAMDADDRVELRRFVARLRAELRIG